MKAKKTPLKEKHNEKIHNGTVGHGSRRRPRIWRAGEQPARQVHHNGRPGCDICAEEGQKASQGEEERRCGDHFDFDHQLGSRRACRARQEVVTCLFSPWGFQQSWEEPPRLYFCLFLVSYRGTLSSFRKFTF